MSSYIVSKKQIDAMVDFMYNRMEHGSSVAYNFYRVGDEVKNIGRDEMGQILWDENYRSVNARYGENDKAETYVFAAPTEKYNIMQIVMMMDSYEYQSCETDDWDRTLAHSILARGYRKAISELTNRFPELRVEEADAMWLID